MATILIGQDSKGQAQSLELKLANRHGLIAGATGTGKTITLQSLAEQFSEAGVPVFAADVKGDLSGVAAGPFPSKLWDLFGDKGVPLQATFDEIGPLLLGRLFGLTPTQAGVLDVVFLAAHDHGVRLKTIADMRQALSAVAANHKTVSAHYGYVAPSTIAIIQRSVVALEQSGAGQFFGEPSFEPMSLIRTQGGKGVINLLAADRLMGNPQAYVVFVTWILMKLFEVLPEVGDPAKPKLVFFFDEAHLLFDNAPKALLDAVERAVRLIRSKGVGIYFVTQSPTDVPEKVLAQLGNRVQHALRAFTPKDARAVRAAAETFRPNPEIDTGQAITELKTGEALVSTLRQDGTPSMVQRVRIRHPVAQMGPLSTEQRAALIGPRSGFQSRIRMEVNVRPKKKRNWIRITEYVLAASIAYWLITGIAQNWAGVGFGG